MRNAKCMALDSAITSTCSLGGDIVSVSKT